MIKRNVWAAALGFALTVSGSGVAWAQSTYPDKPISIIAGYAPGGPVDFVARLIADGIRGPLGVPVLVENKAGAAGSIAADQVARSKPDGYTALLTSLNHVTNAVLNKSVKFDTAKTFAPIAIVAVAPHVLVVSKDSPIKNYADFLRSTQSKPGTVTVATSGNGGSPHLVMELFQLKTKTSLVHVPYKGAAPAIGDLLGGHVQTSFSTLGSVGAQISAGQLRAIAIASDKRSSLLPDTPTFAELGVEGLVLDSWYGVLFPADTAPAIVSRVHAAVSDVAKSPEFAKKLYAAGMESVTDSTPASYDARIQEEIALVRDITEKAGITID